MSALQSFLKTSEKRLGVPARAFDDESVASVEVVSTGSLALDHAIGVGGIPRGRITEIYGPTGGGKTTLALTAAKHCQDLGGIVAFIDAEQALNPELVTAIGLDKSRLVLVQPDHGNQAADISKALVESDLFDMVIMDSAAAMTPKEEVEADMDQNFMGLLPRLLSRWMRSITVPVQRHNVSLVVINQVRTNLSQYGAPNDSTGGQALKFYSSLRIEVRTSAGRQIKNGSEVIGTTVLATVKKNKFAAPFKKAEYDVMFGKGIDPGRGAFTVGLELGVINKSGNTYTVVKSGADLEDVDVRLAVGQPKAIEALHDDAELLKGVEDACRAVMRGASSPEPEPEPEEEVNEEPGLLAGASAGGSSSAANGENFFGLDD